MLQCPNSPTEWDVVINTDFKTELVAWLASKGSLTNIQFMDIVPYEKKKKKKNKIKFLKDERFQEAFYKKDKVLVCPCMC